MIDHEERIRPVDLESLMQQTGRSTRAMAEHYAKDAELFNKRSDDKPFMPELETVAAQ